MVDRMPAMCRAMPGRMTLPGPKKSSTASSGCAAVADRSHRDSTFALPDEGAIFVGRAEIDVDALHPVAGEGEEFGIAKALAAFGHAKIRHESLVAVDEDPLQFVPLD